MGGAAAAVAATPAWYEVSPGLDVRLGVQAIVPLVIFLMVVLFGILKEKLPNAFIIVWGLFLCVLGMCTFNIGLTYGLAALGSQTGSLIPGAFVAIEAMPNPTRPIRSRRGAPSSLPGWSWSSMMTTLCMT